MNVVDSNVWIDYFKGTPSRETDHLDSILGVVPIGVGDLIIASYCIDMNVPLLF